MGLRRHFMRHHLAPLASPAAVFILAIGGIAAARDSRVADVAEQRDRMAVVALIKRGADVNAAQPDGATALHWAGHWNDVAMAADLLHAGAGPNSANDYGVTPL